MLSLSDLLMSNPRGYAELSCGQMQLFLTQYASANEFTIDRAAIHQLTADIFGQMSKKYLKLDTARDFYAFARHKNQSFKNFLALQKS